MRFVGYRTTRNKRPENSSEQFVTWARIKPEISRTEKHHVQLRFSYIPFIINKEKFIGWTTKGTWFDSGIGTIYVKPPIFLDWLWKPQSLLFKK
jgi:hypothetical protein